MKHGVIIRQPDSAVPAFFAPNAANRHVPAHQAWSEKPEEALCFASEKDARSFCDVFLPQLAPYVSFTPYTEP